MTAHEIIREALDEGILNHTGRSVGDIASEKVASEIETKLKEEGLLHADN